MGLRAGQRISVRDLLYGLILRSGNDAAHTLAIAAAGSQARFVRQMNRYAAALGLADTHYANPVGLDQQRQLLQRPRPGDADPAPAARSPPSPRSPTRAAPSCAASTRRGGSRRSTSCCSMAPWVNGVKTGHTFGAALRPGRLRPPQGGRADLGRDRRPDRRRPLRRQPRTARIRLLASTGGGSRSSAGQDLADPSIRYSGGELPLRAARARRRRPAPRPAPQRRGQGAGRGRGADPPRRRARPRDRLRRRPAGRRGAAARRPLDPRGERLRPRPRLPRQPPDPYRAGDVRDTDGRGTAVPPAVPQNDEGERNRVNAK